MKKKWMIVMTVAFAMIASGCQDKPVEIEVEPVDNSAIESPLEEAVVEEAEGEQPVEEPADEIVDIDFEETFRAQVDAKDQEGVRLLLIENGKSIDKEILDGMVHEYIRLLESNYGVYTDPFYTGDDYEIHMNIMDIHDDSDRFKGPVFAGAEKYELVDKLSRDKDKRLVKETFDAGYALFMAEGSYYPVIDFKELNDYLGMFVSEPMQEYLTLVVEDIEKPLTNEEYLAVDVSELKDRAYAYEAFIRENPEFESVTYIRNNLMVALYKLSGPNIFDGMLTDEFRLTDEMLVMYESIISENRSPILVEIAEKVLAFSEERDGVLGSFENLDDLYTFASETHAVAGEQVDALLVR